MSNVAPAPLSSLAHELVHKDLQLAHKDLDNIRPEAAEQGFPEPTDAMQATARDLLEALHHFRPRKYRVYAMPEHKIAIHAGGGPSRSSVILLCDARGGASCLVSLPGNYRRAWFQHAHKIVAGFARDALADLDWYDRAYSLLAQDYPWNDHPLQVAALAQERKKLAWMPTIDSGAASSVAENETRQATVVAQSPFSTLMLSATSRLTVSAAAPRREIWSRWAMPALDAGDLIEDSTAGQCLQWTKSSSAGVA